MLRELEQPALSEYASIYDRLIPRDHILTKINELIDFSFIVDELREKYCLVDGRNAFSPILLFKYLLLKVIYNLSDRDLVERSLYDMSFKYFLGLRPKMMSSIQLPFPSSVNYVSKTKIYWTCSSERVFRLPSKKVSSRARLSSLMPRIPGHGITINLLMPY